MSSFPSFVLDRVARNPSLIAETTQSLQPNSRTSTLDGSQRAVLAPFISSAINNNNSTPPRKLQSPAVTSSADSNVILQRAIVDSALSPLGGEHLLYGTMWSAFLTAAAGARKEYAARQALSKSGVADSNAQEVEGAGKQLQGNASSPSPDLHLDLEKNLRDAEEAFTKTKMRLEEAHVKTHRAVKSMTEYAARPVAAEGPSQAVRDVLSGLGVSADEHVNSNNGAAAGKRPREDE